MKKILTLLALFLITVSTQAQDLNLLDSIKATNGRIMSFEADLSNTLVNPKKTSSQEGKLYFVAPYEFAAMFKTGKFMIVNEHRIKMDIGLFHGTFKLREGGMMQSLGNIFLFGFQGRIQELADENGYNMVTETKDGFHIINCTTRKKKLIGIGYKQVIFKFLADSLLLKEIVLFDYSGDMDTYTISNVKYDVAVDPKKFIF